MLHLVRIARFLSFTVALQFSTGCGGSGTEPLPGGNGASGTGGSPGGDGDVAEPGAAAGGDVISGEPPTGPAATGEGAPTAVEAAAQMGRGFNLGQMFENDQHPRTLVAASAKIDAYYERGFRNVRIPITWTEEVGGDLLVNDATVGNVNPDHPRLAEIASVIDYALSKPDLFVVINAHHEHALKTEARADVLERLWQDITSIFGDRDPRLLFEILNEPHKDDTTAMAPGDLRHMTGLAYAKIRALNPARIVIIGGNQWFGYNEVPAVWTSLEEVGGGADPYVMATFHHYNPWSFCGDNQGTYDDAWTDVQLHSPMETMARWAETVGGGMPIYIGEWGVGWGSRYQTMACNNIRLWYESFDAVAAAPKGQPTAVWDDGGWFKIFDHRIGDFDNNLIDCLEGECSWDGEERNNVGCE